MRITPYLPKIAILTLGIAIGLVIAFVVRQAAPGLTPPVAMPEPMPTPLKGSSAELGATLLQRVGSHLIADNRTKRSENGPILFYAEPKPFGDTLCRVDVYAVAPKVVRGQRLEKEKWDDDLIIERLYGLWKRPSAIG